MIAQIPGGLNQEPTEWFKYLTFSDGYLPTADLDRNHFSFSHSPMNVSYMLQLDINSISHLVILDLCLMNKQ